MEDLTLRFHLESLEDPEEKLTIYASIASKKNGLMAFPIQLEKWKILSIERPTGVRDVAGKEIFEGDELELVTYFLDSDDEESELFTVFYSDGAFRVETSKGTQILTQEFVKNNSIHKAWIPDKNFV